MSSNESNLNETSAERLARMFKSAASASSSKNTKKKSVKKNISSSSSSSSSNNNASRKKKTTKTTKKKKMNLASQIERSQKRLENAQRKTASPKKNKNSSAKKPRGVDAIPMIEERIAELEEEIAQKKQEEEEYKELRAKSREQVRLEKQRLENEGRFYQASRPSHRTSEAVKANKAVANIEKAIKEKAKAYQKQETELKALRKDLAERLEKRERMGPSLPASSITVSAPASSTRKKKNAEELAKNIENLKRRHEAHLAKKASAAQKVLEKMSTLNIRLQRKFCEELAARPRTPSPKKSSKKAAHRSPSPAKASPRRRSPSPAKASPRRRSPSPAKTSPFPRFLRNDLYKPLLSNVQ